jgi:hypothetical protein
LSRRTTPSGHDETAREVPAWRPRLADDDEFLGSRVEIALTERRRIDRVEELSQLCDADLYDLASLRESVPSGRPRLRRHLSS